MDYKSGSIAVKTPPPPGTNRLKYALPLQSEPEPLVLGSPLENREVAPLPRSLSLVDPRQPLMRRIRFWALGLAERWVKRHKPLPSEPTMAQLDRLRTDLASMQRRIDRMLG